MQPSKTIAPGDFVFVGSFEGTSKYKKKKDNEEIKLLEKWQYEKNFDENILNI